MHSLRLHCNRSKLYRQIFKLMEKNSRPISPKFYTTNAAIQSDSNDAKQFKAAVLHPKKTNLNIETLVLPNVAPEGTVRIGIDYCAVNSFDVKCIHDEINSVTLPFIPGSEFSGEILEVGPSCKKNFKIGDKVAVLSSSKDVGGGLSHQCFAPETECIHIDPRLTTEQATSIIQGYSNALFAFSKLCPIKEGDDIIVIAGPGGDGLAAIEVAHKIFGANVCVLFGSKSVNALIRGDVAYKAMSCNAGLTKVYNYFKTTLNSKQFKAVYDTNDSKLLHVVADFISPNGHFLTEDPFFSPETFEAPYFKKDTGKKVKKKATIDDIETPEDTSWMNRVKKVDITKFQVSDPGFYEKTIHQVFDWYATERIEPYPSHKWSLRDVNKAIQFVNTKKCLGKVLIETQRYKF